MKNSHDEVVLNDVYHTIKSPIVSIKSMLFVLGRNKDVQNNKVVQDKLFQIEEKVNLLHKRAEIFLNYIVFKEGNVEFLYSFFDLTEVINNVMQKIHQEYGERFAFKKPVKEAIMADQDHIAEALRIIFTRIHMNGAPGEIPVTVGASGRLVNIILRYQINSPTEEKPQDRDEENVIKQQQYVAQRIIEMHGGNVSYTQKGTEMEAKISLPMKARASAKRK